MEMVLCNPCRARMAAIYANHGIYRCRTVDLALGAGQDACGWREREGKGKLREAKPARCTSTLAKGKEPATSSPVRSLCLNEQEHRPFSTHHGSPGKSGPSSQTHPAANLFNPRLSNGFCLTRALSVYDVSLIAHLETRKHKSHQRQTLYFFLSQSATNSLATEFNFYSSRIRFPSLSPGEITKEQGHLVWTKSPQGDSVRGSIAMVETRKMTDSFCARA